MVRTVQPDKQIKAKLNEIEACRSSLRVENVSAQKFKRDDWIEYVATALSKMAESTTNLQSIVIQDTVSVTDTDPGAENLEKAKKVPSTFTLLVKLENTIMSRMDGFSGERDKAVQNSRGILLKRLAQTCSMIDNAMSTMNKPSQIFNEG